MKRFSALVAAVALLANLPTPVFAQQQGTTKVVGTCGTEVLVAGKMAYPSQDTTGLACTSGGGGGGGGAVTIADGADVALGSTTATTPCATATTSGCSLTAIERAILLQAQSTSPVATNTTQVNGVTTLTGAGATGTGSQRETVAQDTTTIAGSAPGTAGSASANVVTVQGIASGTNVPVSAASGAIADGGIATIGLKADAATCATTNTLLACARQLDADIKASIPAGTNVIGDLLGATHAQCSALCSNLVAKASSGVLKTFEVSADSTLSGAIWYVIVFDATSLPANGAITPTKCYQQPSGTTQMGGALPTGGTSMTTGITIGVSTTGCFSQTASIHAFIAADYN